MPTKAKSSQNQPRSLRLQVEELVLARQKMLFLSGPRQAGKSTLARSFLKDEKVGYFSWDEPQFKRLWTRGSRAWGDTLLSQDIERIVLDEFHKNLRWKNQLKGFYDHFGRQIQVIVTGSAHLNTYRKGADSLTGRFVHFHVHPFTLGELLDPKPMPFIQFKEWLKDFTPSPVNGEAEKVVEQLERWSGFPEPFLAQSDQVHAIWSRNRLETIIRQDLRDTSQLLQLGQVEVLAGFLPERVGSPLSVQSLVEDLDVAHSTVQRWLAALESVYYHYRVLPMTRSIPRSLKKEPKIYLYDWTLIEGAGPRFENMVAGHLKKLVDHYTDTGQASLELGYLRNKEKDEVDFVLLDKGRAIATFEAKLTDRTLSSGFKKFQKYLRVPHFQVIKTPGVCQRHQDDKGQMATVISFERFFSGLP